MKARIVGLCVLVALAVAAAASFGLGGRDDRPAAHPRTGPAATTTVTRQTLVQAVTLTGRLGYGDPVPLTSAATGTVTWLPASGTLVKRGGVLLRADDRPVVLLYGAIPSYRDLAEPAKGADVRQLKRNLAALGYRGFTLDEDFSAATTAAVKRWQHDLDLPETGLVERGRVVYASTAVRIAKQLVRLGASAAGDVLSYTGSTRVVTVPADAGEADWATAGTSVTVTLPSGTQIGGTVTAKIQAPSTSEDHPTGDVITIAVADQAALGQQQEGEVGVRYVAKERKDVLTVPVPALLALAEGGYGLEIVDGTGRRVVAVTVGLFADGRVEVAGPDISEGTVVGLPA